MYHVPSVTLGVLHCLNWVLMLFPDYINGVTQNIPPSSSLPQNSGCIVWYSVRNHDVGFQTRWSRLIRSLVACLLSCHIGHILKPSTDWTVDVNMSWITQKSKLQLWQMLLCQPFLPFFCGYKCTCIPWDIILGKGR